MSKFQIFQDGRAAGSVPVSGSDFVTKDYLTSESVAANSASTWVAAWSKSLQDSVSSASIWSVGKRAGSAQKSQGSASGNESLAYGYGTEASGSWSHAEGWGSLAKGQSSHAEGYQTITTNPYEHAEGRNNATASDQVFSVGAGYATRSNAISVITFGDVNSNYTRVYINGVGGYFGSNPTTTNHVAAVISKLTGSVASASYNSTDKKIYFYNNAGTAVANIDATDFIKDGMVDSVAVSQSYLVLTFNTDAGKEPVSMSLTQIFNPDNFYTKSDVDTLLTTMSVGDVNVIEAIEFNGTASSISGKTASINVEIPAAPNQDAENWVTENSASLVASASVAKTASSSAAALSAKSASWDAKVGLPAVTAADNGKILRVVSGSWTLITPVTVYSGQNAPDNSLGTNGDIYLQS